MIKLHFEPICFKNRGTHCEGSVTVGIKLNKKVIDCKTFITRINLHKDDTFDLNKAYKYIQASLEKKAYFWAYKIINKHLKTEEDFIKEFKSFVDKADYIIKHDEEYLKTF